MYTVGIDDAWFTSDWHIGHRNIREKFIFRPFRDDRAMTDAVLDAVMSKVPRGARLYILGDMFWRTTPLEEALRVMDVLSTFQKYYIWGNHEELLQKHAVLRERFIWLEKYEEIRSGEKKIFLNHYAQRVWNGSHHPSNPVWHLYGHSHNELPPQGLSFDVGIDTRPDFAPYSIAEISAKMKTLKQNAENQTIDQSQGGCVR